MRLLLRILVAALLSSMSMTLWADSYVYIINSTSETLLIAVDHHSSGEPLTEGSQWRQEAQQIPPYATRRVLAFNRHQGVRRNQQYSFETHIQSNTSRITAKQQMVGNWIGSSIEHSAEGDDFTAGWSSDRNIVRHQTEFNHEMTTLAYKAKFTGGYDDFYYTISANTPEEPVSGAGQLKVLSYNIYALPLVATEISARLEELPQYLNGYDVILFQEAFSSDSPAMLRALAAEYPFQTTILRDPFSGINIYNGGVAIVSRYPIGRTEQVVFPECTGTDCFADKGFVYAEIIKAGQAYQILATHAASFDTQAARQMRQAQFRLMRDFVQEKDFSVQDMVLYGGDMNVNRLIFPDDYQAMQQNLQARVPVSTGYTESTFDPRVNYYAATYSTVEYLDYVLFSEQHRLPSFSRNDVRIFRSTSGSLWERWDLSDHFPVMGEFHD